MINTKEKRHIQKQKEAKKKMIMLLVTVLFISLGSISFGCSFSDAHVDAKSDPVIYKYYKSIVIQPGDTLWDIANEYKTKDYKSTQEYINELKEINSLKTNNIQQGQCLMVVYYDEAFR